MTVLPRRMSSLWPQFGAFRFRVCSRHRVCVHFSFLYVVRFVLSFVFVVLTIFYRFCLIWRISTVSCFSSMSGSFTLVGV
ncbi:hypothetical protein Hanom_Chr16g01436881 [Helianthus anomalus]